MTDQPTLVAAMARIPQDAATEGADGGQGWLAALKNLDAIEWIDWTAIVLLFVFFLLGLFKGFVWQVSRILTLVGAWFLAGRYGPDGEVWLHEMFDSGTTDPNFPGSDDGARGVELGPRSNGFPPSRTSHSSVSYRLFSQSVVLIVNTTCFPSLSNSSLSSTGAQEET